jgi:hypothetical protein
MSDKLLTFGSACYKDFEGAWMTLKALKVYHAGAIDFLVIDNAPSSCKQTKGITEAVGGRYLHRPDLHGTSAPRDALFRLAKTPWVMCGDSHIMLEPEAIARFLDYVKADPESRDILTGPMHYDDGKTICTHWRQDNCAPGLWGVWDTDPRYLKGEPFEIPMQGLGLFAMSRAAWPGFNPLFRGFGGEEGYIHEKVRQDGGRCLCLPALGWHHRFRDPGSPVPYPLSLDDHTWNLLVGHRELGIDAVAQIYEHFGKRLPVDKWNLLKTEAEKVQAFGVRNNRKRLKLLGVWYSNNAAPVPLLQKSLATIKRSVDETMFHDVEVVTCSWQSIPGNPFSGGTHKPSVQGHAAIIEQIRRCLLPGWINGAVYDDPYEWEYLVFLEHDVLYPPNYFDRIGNAARNEPPVVSNLDYEGLNATGWLKVKERHEPMHQLAMRRDVALANLDRAQEDCRRQGWALLEPQGDRNDWARIPPVGLMPSIHVNH